MPADKNKRIAIVGAGPMGLGVAFELVRLGYKPTIFEADDRIGGMTACFDFDGLPIERYYHFHCTSDTDFFEVLDELGLKDCLHWRETKMGYWFHQRLQPWGNPVALLKFRGLSLMSKIRYGLFAFYCTKLRNWQRIDGMEATQWIRNWVGEEAYNALWHKLFYYKFYELSQALSASWIWARVRRIGQSRYSIFKEKLGYLEGGSQTWLNAMQDFLAENGAFLRLSTPVEKILTENGRVTGIQTRQADERFDIVISTAPLPLVPRFTPDLPAATLQQYQALKNVAVVCVIMKIAKPVSENFWLNVNDEAMDIPGLVEYSNLQLSSPGVVYVPFYMPGENAKFLEPDEVFIEKCKSYLKTINPSLTDDDFIAARASRYRWAQPVCGPNFLDTLPPVKSEIANLWIADTSHYYPEDRGISESLGFGRDLARKAINQP